MSGAQGGVFHLFNTVPVRFVWIGQVGANRGLIYSSGQHYSSTLPSCLQNNYSNWYFNLYKHELDYYCVMCNILPFRASYYGRDVYSRRREAWLARRMASAAIIAERKNIHQKPSWRGMKPCNHLNKQTNKQTLNPNLSGSLSLLFNGYRNPGVKVCSKGLFKHRNCRQVWK